MADENDQTLIRAYARNRCESSFSELVHRHVDIVHSTALRVLRDADLAEDVTQRVFVALAQPSAKLQERLSLAGWLHETTWQSTPSEARNAVDVGNRRQRP